MFRPKASRAARRTASFAAAIALLGAVHAGHAETAETSLAALPDTDHTGALAGADEPRFASSFLPYDTPADPLQRPGAVDVTAIEPAEPAAQALGTGIASYYGRRFHGRLTANGERFDMNALTAAHKTLPFGSQVRVTNPGNGRSVVVRINDRGPFVRGRQIDLSRAAAEQIGIISSGHGQVELELLAG